MQLNHMTSHHIQVTKIIAIKIKLNHIHIGTFFYSKTTNCKMSPSLKKELVQSIVYSIFIAICIKLVFNAYRMLEYYESIDNSIKNK